MCLLSDFRDIEKEHLIEAFSPPIIIKVSEHLYRMVCKMGVQDIYLDFEGINVKCFIFISSYF